MVLDSAELLRGELLLLGTELVGRNTNLLVEVLAPWHRVHGKGEGLLGDEAVVRLQDIVIGGSEGGVEFLGGVIEVAADGGSGEVKSTMMTQTY